MKSPCLDFCFWEAGSLVYRKQELRKFPLSSGIQARNGQMEDALKGALNSTAFDKAHDFQASLHFFFRWVPIFTQTRMLSYCVRLVWNDVSASLGLSFSVCSLVSHLVFQLVWDAVSAFLLLGLSPSSPACLRSCLPACVRFCLWAGLECCVRQEAAGKAETI